MLLAELRILLVGVLVFHMEANILLSKVFAEIKSVLIKVLEIHILPTKVIKNILADSD